MADHVVVMRGRRHRAAGPPLDLYDRPANRFVAGSSLAGDELHPRSCRTTAGHLALDLGATKARLSLIDPVPPGRRSPSALPNTSHRRPGQGALTFPSASWSRPARHLHNFGDPAGTHGRGDRTLR